MRSTYNRVRLDKAESLKLCDHIIISALPERLFQNYEQQSEYVEFLTITCSTCGTEHQLEILIN